MWRRAYLLLLAVRIYFALSPSYLHPDEIFQGPEVIAGKLFAYPAQKTWEWTSSHPIRSVFPLWPVYGIPMTLLKWVWAEDDQGHISPGAIYYALRVVMLILSFVLGDWAVYELVHSPRHRRQAVVLVASSYVTWTYQSHTFSNSIETILVAWSLVLLERISCEKNRSSVLSCGILSFIVIFGIFNRITFPAFLLIPGLPLLPHFLSRPLSLLSMTSSALVFTCLAIATDTAFYHGPDSTASFRALFKSLSTTPVITPWNSIRYNMQTSNLALHGLHPRHQHLSVNLPQLLGPALILLVTSSPQPLSIRNLALPLSNPCFLSAISGTALLSIFPHQEPRFLLPCVPLLLTCVRTPTSPSGRKWFWTSWLTFNIVLGTLIGVYHQGGVIPAQLQVPAQIKLDHSTNHLGKATPAMVFWWKTYPPPTYLLGKTNPFDISTVPLLGLPHRQMVSKLSSALPPTCDNDATTPLPEHQLVYLVAPLASHFFLPASSFTPNTSFSVDASPTEQDTSDAQQAAGQHTTLSFTLQWKHRRHINLDDMDIGEEGLLVTLRRVVGRRGIGIWRVRRVCNKTGGRKGEIIVHQTSDDSEH